MDRTPLPLRLLKSVSFLAAFLVALCRRAPRRAKHLPVSVPQLGTSLQTGTGGQRKPGEKVSVAFRPEKVTISRQQPAAGGNFISGKVQDFGYFGKDSLYRIKLVSGAVVSVNTVNAARRGESENVATWEDDDYLSVADEAVMLFDPES